MLKQYDTEGKFMLIQLLNAEYEHWWAVKEIQVLHVES